MDGTLTLRENIMLLRGYDIGRYTEVIRACVLDVDLAQLRDGELTLVSGKGMQLSGSQRACIALARVFCHNADAVLLDNPLSAVEIARGGSCSTPSLSTSG